MATPLIAFREYQLPVFTDRTTGVELLHWSRQIGKSFTVAGWAVDRCLTRPGRLVTVLSNSRDNGGELMVKAQEVCDKMNTAVEMIDESPDLKFENLRMEARIKVRGKYSRIKVLAANPRTARGFSGDLILDEFAFHEDSDRIWEAAEPILSSNPDYLCRIASTGNGTHNMFYRLRTGGMVKVSCVPRSLAWKMGVKIYHPITRQPITPEEARALAHDKRAYDQNYECQFGSENMALLTHDLISSAEVAGVTEFCNQDWSPAAIERMRQAHGDLYAGIDVGRERDLTCIGVFEKIGPLKILIALLRIEGMRLPDQQARLGVVCNMKKFRKANIDMTGIGLGLTEYSQDAFGRYRITGINFSSTVPMSQQIKLEGRKGETVRVTELMATQLLSAYEDRSIKHGSEPALRDALRKPEKIVGATGRVSIAATRSDAGHADEFWAIALGVHAMESSGGPFVSSRVTNPNRSSRRMKGVVV